MKSYTDGVGGATGTPQCGKKAKYLHSCNLLLRILGLAFSIPALVLMVTAKQSIANGALKASWRDSKAFYALAVSSAIAIGYFFLHSILALLSLKGSKGACKSKSLMWVVFLADQLLAYLLLGTGAASAEVGYIAKYGSSHAGWNAVCSMFDWFCDRVFASIILSFIAMLVLAICSILSAFQLFHNYTAGCHQITGTDHKTSDVV